MDTGARVPAAVEHRGPLAASLIPVGVAAATTPPLVATDWLPTYGAGRRWLGAASGPRRGVGALHPPAPPMIVAAGAPATTVRRGRLPAVAARQAWFAALAHSLGRTFDAVFT